MGFLAVCLFFISMFIGYKQPLCSWFVAFLVERMLVGNLNRASQLIGCVHKEYIRALDQVLSRSAGFVRALIVFWYLFLAVFWVWGCGAIHFGSNGEVLQLVCSRSKEESCWARVSHGAHFHWRHVVGSTRVPGGSWLYCFEAVKLVESDVARAVFCLLAVTPDLLRKSYTVYSLTSIICHWSWLVKELSGKNVFVKRQHIKPGMYQKYDTVDEACQKSERRFCC